MGLLEPSPIPQSCRYHSEETLINQPPQTFRLRLLADVQVFCSAAQTGEGLKKKKGNLVLRLMKSDWNMMIGRGDDNDDWEDEGIHCCQGALACAGRS